MLGKIEYGVRVVSVVELLMSKHDILNLSREEEVKCINDFISDNNAHYYCKEKHKFSILSAINEAHDLGKSVVLVQNLS